MYLGDSLMDLAVIIRGEVLVPYNFMKEKDILNNEYDFILLERITLYENLLPYKMTQRSTTLFLDLLRRSLSWMGHL